MVSPKFFIDTLKSCDIDFFAGVPDSLLKNICAYIADHVDDRHNIIAANEGAAVGLAACYGYSCRLSSCYRQGASSLYAEFW